MIRIYDANGKEIGYKFNNRSVYHQYIQFMFIIFLLNIFNKNIYKLNINILVDWDDKVIQDGTSSILNLCIYYYLKVLRQLNI